MNKMIKRLNMLGILYYVLAGLCLLASLVCAYLVIKYSAIPSPENRVVLMMGAHAGQFVLLLMAGCLAFVGYAIRKHRWWTFCFIMSILFCLSFPTGTVLGVISILMLSKPETKKLFAPNQQNQPIAGKPVSG